MNYKLETVSTTMCVWEALMDRKGGGVIDAYTIKQDWVGVSEMREIVILNLVPAIERAWLSVSKEVDMPFDLEFISKFLDLAEPFLRAAGSGRSWNIADHKAVSIGIEILGVGE
jgi:hypothetical protein